jgi:DNA-binding MarR family transcriptional regulator
MSPDFIETLGLPFLAHRLRRVSDAILRDVGAVFRARGIELPPRGGSLVMLLAESGRLPVTEAAHRLKLSHPLIITLSKTLAGAGFVVTASDSRDKRRRLLSLTKKGRELAAILEGVNRSLSRSYREIFDEAGIDLFAAIQAFEGVTEKRSLAGRLGGYLDEDLRTAKRTK